MALISQPRRDDERSGWASASETISAGSIRLRSLFRSQRGLRPDSQAPRSFSRLDAVLSDFTASRERGETPSIEEYLARLDSASSSDVVELIYHAYCLSETAGLNPDPADYIGRFPAQSRSLERLFGLHKALDTSEFPPWADPAILPEVGDEIGPYRLLRELGEGGFARVFLAEQWDLDRRLVVVKVSSRITPEPQLLARARHSHIVEVFWHSLINDGVLQLICMPFLGGATLAAILADRKRRGGRPRSGRDLLAALDRVSAREYPTPDLARPAREIIAGLSYPKGVARIIARLAEALDFAYGRGVLHGDVKPSNVLLTADGVPMLLDFNLAVGWHSAGFENLPEDVGGTLAYMAPERLRALANPEDAAVPTAADRHRADLYSLGMVLLENLAGRTPDHPRGSPRSPRELARAFALSRQQGGGTLIRSCRATLAPALRSIVIRCLAPDPADRYNRASELAEDLDRWCGDRPLAFAREPRGWSGLFRRARRRRLAVAAALLSLTVVAVSSLAVWCATETSLRERAQAMLARLWDDIESKAFRFGYLDRWRLEETDVPEDAFHQLACYNVLGDGDWRTRDEVRALPESDREELEVWLLEQALRLGRALRQRPDSPDDWRRGLEALDRVVALRPLGPLETQRRLLRRRLDLPEPPGENAPDPGADPPPRWMEEYLLGIEAEPLRAKDARAHYRHVLQERPESFWGHYRAAAVAYRLHEPADAVGHLKHCIASRPENPVLRGLLAGCLYKLREFDAEALEQCNKALALNPDFAEAYRTRAFIRGRLGQGEGIQGDIDRFDLLTRRLGKLPSWRLRLDWIFSRQADEVGTLDRVLEGSDLPQRVLAADPEDVDLRTALAVELMETGYPDVALAEFDKVLELNPDHLRARYHRGGLLYKRHPDEADGDFSYLLEHPRFEELCQKTERAIYTFQYESTILLKKGEVDKALEVARRGLAYADQIQDRKMQGELHYYLARVHAVAARSDPEQLRPAAAHLWRTRQYDSKYLEQWFGQDPFFKSQQGKIELLIGELREDVARVERPNSARSSSGLPPVDFR